MFCADCKVCRAQWKHCYPKWIYHLVWLLRLLANRRRLELFPSDTALCPSVTTRIHNVWEFSMSTGGLFTVWAKRKICQLSPFFHGFHHLIDTTEWTSTNVPKLKKAFTIILYWILYWGNLALYSIVGDLVYKAFRHFQSHIGLPLQWSIWVHHDRKLISIYIRVYFLKAHCLESTIPNIQISTFLHMIYSLSPSLIIFRSLSI